MILVKELLLADDQALMLIEAVRSRPNAASRYIDFYLEFADYTIGH